MLDQAKEITSLEYMNLVNPEWKAQSRIDESMMYWMIFKSEGILYKIHNKL